MEDRKGGTIPEYCDGREDVPSNRVTTPEGFNVKFTSFNIITLFPEGEGGAIVMVIRFWAVGRDDDSV